MGTSAPRLHSVLLLLAMILLSGCGISATSIYPGTGLTYDLSESGVKVLGEVKACEGGFCHNDETGRTEWPLSLSVPPPASHYQAALRRKASRIYNVPEREIVLGEITVGFYNELNGTVRGWEAETIAGRKVGEVHPISTEPSK